MSMQLLNLTAGSVDLITKANFPVLVYFMVQYLCRSISRVYIEHHFATSLYTEALYGCLADQGIYTHRSHMLCFNHASVTL